MVDILLFEIRQKVSKSTADISVYVRTVQFDPQLSHNYSETMSASLLIYLLRPLGGRSPVYPFTSMMKSPACQTLLKHFSVRLASDVWMVCEKRRFTTNGSHLRCLNKAHQTAPLVSWPTPVNCSMHRRLLQSSATHGDQPRTPDIVCSAKVANYNYNNRRYWWTPFFAERFGQKLVIRTVTIFLVKVSFCLRESIYYVNVRQDLPCTCLLFF